MIPLFSQNSLKLLESLSFTDTLYAFDYDGTLVPIVKSPVKANLRPSTELLFRELCERVEVAVISGRGIKDLSARLSVKPQYLAGNHGLEMSGKSTKSMEKAKRDCSQWVRRLKKISFPQGVELEDKKFSLCLHYRQSRNKAKAKQVIEAAIETLSPKPRVVGGKCVFNLVPVKAPHKGVAVHELMKKMQAKHVFYIGDDVTDEDVFSFPSDRIMTVRVGKKQGSRAQFYIERQSDINRLLRHLLRFHPRPVKVNK